MNRRDAIKLTGLALSSVVLPSISRSGQFEYLDLPIDQDHLKQLERLRGERPAYSSVKIERGGPRLFINGKEEYPFFAGSSGLIHTIKSFKESGIKFFHPLISIEAGWIGAKKYEWSGVDNYLARLLALVPDAVFLPRIHLYAPDWWKESHPDEVVSYGLPIDVLFNKMEKLIIDSGLNWNCVLDAYGASLASEIWQRDMGETLRSFLRHMEQSPLQSRIIGYHYVGAMTAEWHYTGARYLPDYSKPMQRVAGPVPTKEQRMTTTSGLLRDPEKEQPVIDFYRRFHENTAAVAAHFAGIIKQETKRRVVVGTFFSYVLENVSIQEAGHLVPHAVLNSKDIDYLACPYTYEHGNVPGKQRWESDIIDDTGRLLGRARGVGGDGGFRILLESLRRHKKLFISEIDPATYLEPVKTTEGGTGFDTLEGTLRILRRDITQVFAQGCGGWLFEFGHIPSFKANRGWYDSEPMIKEVRGWMELGQKRPELAVDSVAEIAAVYDVKSFFATQHWKAEEPWGGFGISISDFFNHWLLNTQARTIHRIGAPVDFLYRFDLRISDARRYKLFIMPNLFYLTANEVQQLRIMFKGSGATVIWYYAPGYITPKRFDLHQMEMLTGFKFERIDQPGSMMIDCAEGRELLGFGEKFGVKKDHFPRFVVDASASPVRVLGRWTDNNEVAFARRDYEGWKSVYAGSGPLPVELLRPLAEKAGVRLWSSEPDVIRATRDAVMITATSKGGRTLQLHKRMRPSETSNLAIEHTLEMEHGDVKVFVGGKEVHQRRMRLRRKV
ncbi:MAG: hypothetical protein V1799_04015 [bacterium]